MEVLDSFELRWFVTDGHLSASALEARFADTEPVHRVDSYLLTGCPYLTVKIRDVGVGAGRIETKYRTGTLPRFAAADGLGGTLERWRKLSWRQSAASQPDAGQWIEVEKRRRLRQFVFSAGSAVEQMPGSEREAGCTAECSRIRWREREVSDADDGQTQADRSLLTIAFEAFGPQYTLLPALLATVPAVLGRDPAMRLFDGESMGYAQWLLQRP